MASIRKSLGALTCREAIVFVDPRLRIFMPLIVTLLKSLAIKFNLVRSEVICAVVLEPPVNATVDAGSKLTLDKTVRSVSKLVVDAGITGKGNGAGTTAKAVIPAVPIAANTITNSTDLFINKKSSGM